jgi:hypothetical protein
MKDMLKSFFNGECYNAYEFFGAHPYKSGYVFRVYAPNALEVEVVGDFNDWDGCKHKMNKIDDRGIYELYISKVKKNYEIYRYRIKTKRNVWIEKSDPYAFYGELRPNTASKTFDLSKYKFSDEKWMNKRTKGEEGPVNIYEIHLGSFRKNIDDTWMSYEQLAPILVKYVKEHLSSIAPNITWSQVEEEMKKLMEEEPENYPTENYAVDKALIEASGGKVTLEQINKYKDEYDPFAWTIALAPADDPKIAVVVVLVQGGTSYNAGPVVRDIIGEYLLNETKFDKADFTTKMQ